MADITISDLKPGDLFANLAKTTIFILLENRTIGIVRRMEGVEHSLPVGYIPMILQIKKISLYV